MFHLNHPFLKIRLYLKFLKIRLYPMFHLNHPFLKYPKIRLYQKYHLNLPNLVLQYLLVLLCLLAIQKILELQYHLVLH